MTFVRISVVAIVLILPVVVCSAADQKKEGEIVLQPWVTEAYWKVMTLSKDAPVSDDGRYRLQKVRKNGDVEVLYSDEPEETELIIVKPMPKRFKSGARPPTIVVEESDYARQSAKIRALRAK